MKNLLAPDSAAAVLAISPKTLEAMRVRGNGPAWVKVSARRVAYRVEDLEAYVKARTFSSTSEYGRLN